MLRNAISALTLCTILFLLGCGGYGEKLTFNGGEVYYKSPATKAEAEKLGKALVNQGFFDGSRKSVQLMKEVTKGGDVYQFRMVVRKDIDLDSELVGALALMGPEISHDAFNGAQVEVHLCDEHLKTLKTIPPMDYLTYNNSIVAYGDGVTKAEAERLGNHFTKDGLFKGERKTFRLGKQGDTFILRMTLQPGAEKARGMRAIFEADAKRLSKEVFNDKPVEIHVLDGKLQVHRFKS